MELNFGELIKVEIKLENPHGFYKARINWIFAYGEITGGRITSSKYGDFWVQLPRPELKNGRFIKPIKIRNKELENKLATETLQAYNLKIRENNDYI